MVYSRFCLHGLELGHVVAGDVALELGGVGPGEPPLALRVVDDVDGRGTPSDSQSFFTTPEKAPTRAFSWLKAPTSN